MMFSGNASSLGIVENRGVAEIHTAEIHTAEICIYWHPVAVSASAFYHKSVLSIKQAIELDDGFSN